jgi:hypothetical protein
VYLTPNWGWNMWVSRLDFPVLLTSTDNNPVFKVNDPENFQIWGTVIHLIRTFEKL